MPYRILTLSPGSTSTKVAVFEGTEPIFKANVRHDLHRQTVVDGIRHARRHR